MVASLVGSESGAAASVAAELVDLAGHHSTPCRENSFTVRAYVTERRKRENMKIGCSSPKLLQKYIHLLLVTIRRSTWSYLYYGLKTDVLEMGKPIYVHCAAAKAVAVY